MLFSKLEALEDLELWSYSDEDEEFVDHRNLQDRLRKTMCLGKGSRMEHSTLPLTELTVEYFQDSIPRQLGRVDLQWASSFTRKTSVSPCAMMLGMLYIERLRHRNPDYVAKMSSEDLFLISMMLASKYLYDEGGPEELYNDEWAEAVNMDTDDINELEVDFLQAIDWNLFVDSEDFEELLLATERCIALKETRRRGFLTYTDFYVLLENPEMMSRIGQITTELCQILAVCAFTYSATVLAVTALSMTHALHVQDCRVNDSLDRSTHVFPSDHGNLRMPAFVQSLQAEDIYQETEVVQRPSKELQRMSSSPDVTDSKQPTKDSETSVINQNLHFSMFQNFGRSSHFHNMISALVSNMLNLTILKKFPGLFDLSSDLNHGTTHYNLEESEDRKSDSHVCSSLFCLNKTDSLKNKQSSPIAHPNEKDNGNHKMGHVSCLHCGQSDKTLPTAYTQNHESCSQQNVCYQNSIDSTNLNNLLEPTLMS